MLCCSCRDGSPCKRDIPMCTPLNSQNCCHATSMIPPPCNNVFYICSRVILNANEHPQWLFLIVVAAWPLIAINAHVYALSTPLSHDLPEKACTIGWRKLIGPYASQGAGRDEARCWCRRVLILSKVTMLIILQGKAAWKRTEHRTS